MGLIQRRTGLLCLAFLALLAVAGARSAWLGTVRASSLKHAAVSQQVSQVTVPAPRGAILDRNGQQLASSEPADDVAATPYLIKDPAAAAKRIAPLIGRPEADVLKDLARHDTGFVYLARQVPADQADRVDRLHVPGLQVIPTSRRVYPRSWLASQVLGTVGIDGSGLSGLEYSENDVLRGRDGERALTRDALGQPIAVHDAVHARAGETVRTTLDANIEGEVEDALAQIGEQYQPKDATAIVMDPNSGQVLAMANWPRVDGNDIAGAPAYARENRAVGFTYEPGSTFKAFTIAGALQDGLVTPSTTFTIPPELQVADRTLHDAEAHGYEQMTTADILARSSNIGAAKIGMRLGPTRFDGWVRRFGFGSPTGIALPGEQRGIVLRPSQYSGSSMANLPIGQGESVTPIQMADAYAAIANGGILRRPRILESVGGRPVPESPGRRVISARTAAQVRDMLKGVLAPGGTASEVSIPGYELAGKTGTANKVDPKTHTYSDTKYIASFVGFAPADDPKLLCAVMVDEPHGDIYGGSVAAPAFGQIMAFALPYLKIAPH